MRRVAVRLVFALLMLPALGGCHRSRYPEGRDPTVRERLPKKFPIDVLEQADRLEVLALDEPDRFTGRLATNPNVSVRAAVDVESPAQRERLIRTLYRSIHDATLMALCFHPHHAIRARRGADTIEIVVCFSCLQIAVPDGEGGYPTVAIRPGDLLDLFDGIFERQRRLRFDRAKDNFGSWVPMD
ncbi:MAG TPA: hypothetical protein VIF57_10955 [Polyangia bacterium]|jgi:hypothetical protein